jgi:hypothetical protein
MGTSETLNEAATRIATKAFSAALNELLEAAQSDTTVDEKVDAYLRAMREQLEQREREMQSLKRTAKFSR